MVVVVVVVVVVIEREGGTLIICFVLIPSMEYKKPALRTVLARPVWHQDP